MSINPGSFAPITRLTCSPALRVSRVLVCCDDRFHSADGIRGGIAPLADEMRWTFDWLEGKPLPSAEELVSFDVVLIAKSNVLSHQNPVPWLADGGARLLDFTRAGGGVLAVHAGMAGLETAPHVRALIGGAFMRHPPMGDVVVECDPVHPISRDVVSTFAIWDEHYFVSMDDPAAAIFLKTHSAHGVQPAGWTRREGAGRVCALTPGHRSEVWRHPAYSRLIGNALAWATGGRQSE